MELLKKNVSQKEETTWKKNQLKLKCGKAISFLGESINIMYKNLH